MFESTRITPYVCSRCDDYFHCKLTMGARMIGPLPRQ